MIRYTDGANLNPNKHYSLDRIMDFIASDDQNTKVRTRGGERLNYLPTKKLKINVDSQKAVESGVVDERNAEHIVDEVRIKLNRSTLLLSDLMIMDLIASTDWTRPIYFTQQVPGNKYFKQNNHLVQEGLSYKLSPVKNNTNYRGKGMIDAKEMYNTVMNDFEWGGLPDSSLYLGYVTRRNFRIYRNNFSRLSQALIANNENQKAINVIDTCFHYLPNEQVHFESSTTPLVQKYYRAGAEEKGLKWGKKLHKTLADNLDYLLSLSRAKQQQAKRKIRSAMSGLFQLRRASKRADQTEFSKSIKNDLDRFQGQIKFRMRR